MNREDTDVRSLLERIGLGDLRSRLEAAARSQTPLQHDAEDILSEATLAIYESLSGQKRDKVLSLNEKALTARFVTILKNKSVDEHRRRTAEKRGGGDKHLVYEEGHGQSNDTRRKLDVIEEYKGTLASAGASTQETEMFLTVTLGDTTYDDWALRLDVTAEEVKRQVNRIGMLLAAYLTRG